MVAFAAGITQKVLTLAERALQVYYCEPASSEDQKSAVMVDYHLASDHAEALDNLDSRPYPNYFPVPRFMPSVN